MSKYSHIWNTPECQELRRCLGRVRVHRARRGGSLTTSPPDSGYIHAVAMEFYYRGRADVLRDRLRIDYPL